MIIKEYVGSLEPEKPANKKTGPKKNKKAAQNGKEADEKETGK